MSRRISHMVPMDGTQHELNDCFCHPDIHEANRTRSVTGLDEVGVAEADAGALIFMHHPAADTSRWQEWREVSDDEDEATS
jgi:hypothetical protein